MVGSFERSKGVSLKEGRRTARIGAVKEITSLLGLEQIIRMEAYDISNTNGFDR